MIGDARDEAAVVHVPFLPVAGELIGRIGWLIRLRWVAVVGVACFIELARRLFPVRLELAPIYGVLVVIAAYNTAMVFVVTRLAKGEPGRLLGRITPIARVLVPRALWGMELEGRALQAAAFANAQISLDLVALAALLHFAGGIENPFIFFFVFHSIIASILLSRRASYIQTTLAFVLITTMAVAEASGVIAHYPLDGLWREGAYRDPMLIGAQLFVVGATLYLSVYMGSTIAAHLRNRERDVGVLSRQLAEKASKLEGAYSRLSEIERTKSQYMRKVAHELRGPLGTVQTALQSVLMGVPVTVPAAARSLIERAERRTGELAQLTQDLLALSRAREWQILAEDDDIDLGALVEDVVGDWRDRAADHEVDLSTAVPSTAVTLRGDRQGLRQLLGNLISNAIRYTPRGGRVKLVLKSDEAVATLEVSDTGVGIAEADQARVFEEFYRAAQARELVADGTGLGLAIVRAVAQQHGGRVRLDSSPGKGSTFTVELPLERRTVNTPGGSGG